MDLTSLFTISVSDLLLNAVALEFVIGIDEVLFETLARCRVGHLFRNVAGLKLPTKTTWRGLDVGAVTMLLAVASGLLFFNVALLNPQTRTLVRARDVLCAGDVDFVVTKDGIGAFSWSYPDTVDTRRPRSSPPWTSPSLAYPIVELSQGRVGHDTEHPCNSPDTGARGTPKLSYFASMVDVLLRQHGRGFFQNECDHDECYAPHPTLGTPWPKDDRPDCCEAKKCGGALCRRGPLLDQDQVGRDGE